MVLSSAVNHCSLENPIDFATLAASHGERMRGLVVPRRRRSVVLSESER